MEKTNVKVKKWGNSLAVILPTDIVKSQSIREGLDIDIHITTPQKTRVKDIFGILKDWKIDTQEFKDEIRREESNDLLS